MDNGAVTWFSLSLIISGIAQGMNRSGWLWWFFGLIAGPLALLCLVLAGKVKLEEKSGEVTSWAWPSDAAIDRRRRR